MTVESGDGWTMHLGDCLDVMRDMDMDGAETVAITDPVWPNVPDGLFGNVDPFALLTASSVLMSELARRLVIHLGCASDPRILSAIPASLPFVRVCWLRYACPGYLGTVLNSGDVAYVFGTREGPEGRTVLPGEVCSVDALDASRRRDRSGEFAHPTPRKLEHVAWLVRHFSWSKDTVLDPFAGSGTSGVAALRLGRRFVGIEKNPTYFALACDRLRAEENGSTLQASRAGQTALFAKVVSK